jgi:hypothetical protein
MYFQKLRDGRRCCVVYYAHYVFRVPAVSIRMFAYRPRCFSLAGTLAGIN